MKYSLALALLFASIAHAVPQPQNAGRPVPNGACCTANTSLKQDVCNVNGSSGRCVPSAANGCGGALTCIEDARLTCDPNTLERGRPLCRLAGEAAIKEGEVRKYAKNTDHNEDECKPRSTKGHIRNLTNHQRCKYTQRASGKAAGSDT